MKFATLLVLSCLLLGATCSDTAQFTMNSAESESSSDSSESSESSESSSSEEEKPKAKPKKPVAPKQADEEFLFANSGGGWRALVSSMGFARGLANAGVLDNFDMITSVSGGSWFNLQLTYSDRFYKAVINKKVPIKSAVKTWFKDYYKMGTIKNPKALLEELGIDTTKKAFPSLVESKSQAAWGIKKFLRKKIKPRRMLRVIRKKTRRAYKRVKRVARKVKKQTRKVRKALKRAVKKVAKKTQTVTRKIKRNVVTKLKKIKKVVKKAAKKAVKFAKKMLHGIKEFWGVLVRKFKSFAEIFLVCKKYKFNWRKFVFALLDTYTKGLSQMTANVGNKKHLKGTKLLINNVIPKYSRTLSTWKERRDTVITKIQGFTTKQYMFPYSLYIPEKGSAAWYMGHQTSEHSLCDYNIKRSFGLSKYFGKSKVEDQKRVQIGKGYEPRVGDVAAMSSAAAGLFVDGDFLKSHVSTTMEVLIAHKANKMGIQIGASDKHKKKKNVFRIIDGGYIENTGTVSAIAQRQSGPKKVLRFLVLNSDGCKPEARAKKTCFEESNMFWAGRPAHKDICGPNRGTPRACAGRLNPKIFAGVPPKNKPLGIGVMTYFRSKATTIANKEFGVLPGWEVEIINLSTHAEVPTINDGTRGSSKYQRLAAQTEEAVGKLQKLFPDFFKDLADHKLSK